MAWTYTSDVTSPLNQVRLMIGDVDQSDIQLADEELVALLPGGPLACGSVYLAGAQACELIASRYARQVTTKVGTMSALLSDRQSHYRERARDLRRQNVRFGGVTPFAGGISRDTVTTQELDDNRIVPDFSVVTGDNEGGLSGTMPNDGWGYGQ